MRFFDYIKTAFKNLMRQKSRTILTVVAITVGSLSLILMVSIIISIRSAMVEQFQKLGAFSLVTVTKDPNSVDTGSLVSTNGSPDEGKKIDDTTLTQMRALAHVSEATPITMVNIGTIRLEGNPKKTWGNITGFDPNNDVFGMTFVAGRKLMSTDMDKIIVGQRFLEDIGFDGDPKDVLGKKVLLNSKMGGGSAPDWGALPEKPPTNGDNKDFYENQKSIDIPAEIVGVVNNGNMDSGGSYVTMAWAKKLMTQVRWEFGKNCENSKGECEPQMSLVKDSWFDRQGYSSIILKADDQENIDKLAESVSGLGYGANTAKQMLEEINKILTMVGAVLALIGGISLFVAAIGIINTMIMATYERTREIGVMRACGATKSTVSRLFTFEAAILGFSGGILGMTICYVLGLVAKFIVTNNPSSAMSSIPISKIGNFPLWLIFGVISFTTLIGIISGLYPAHRAAKLDPVEALRYE